MRGSYGMLCIALGILAAGLGGYLLNAETVTVCETEWDYVTDVGAAFQGSKADMDIEYNPSSNITGWSDLEGYNNRYIRAVEYSSSERANTYLAYTDPTMMDRGNATVTAGSVSGLTPVSYAIEGTFGNATGTMPRWAGAANGELLTVAVIGDVTIEGAFAIPLSELMEFADLSLWDRVDCYLNSTNYPVFAAGSSTSEVGPGPVTAKFVASSYSTSVSVFKIENAAAIGNETYPIEDVYLFFGHATVDGLSVDSASMFISRSIGSGRVFIDPAYGFEPYTGSYTVQESADIDSPISQSPTMQFDAPYINQNGGGVTVSIVCDTPDDTGVSLGTLESGFRSGLPYIRYEPEPGNIFMDFGSTSGASMRMECSSGVWTVYVDGEAQGTFNGPSEYTEIRATANRTAPYLYTMTVTNDKGDTAVMTQAGAQSLTADMGYTEYVQQVVTHTFDKAYWCNNYDNVSVSIALSRPASGSGSAELYFYGSERNAWLTVSYASGTWSIESNGGTAFAGDWPAILVKVEGSTATAYPLTAFVSFTSYDNVLGPRASVDMRDQSLGTIRMFSAEDTGSNLRMSVVSTTIRLAEGGLYLQDGRLDLQSAFPGTDAASIMIGSTAAVGDSITFTSGGASVTLPVDADKLQVIIGNEGYDLNGIAFRWYSSAGPSASVAGVTYAPAIYDRGKVLESGVIWAETKRGDYIQVMEAPSDWEITLDGVWAPAVFFYTGANEASESTQISDFTAGIFRWDKDTTLIFMMGAAVAGGLIGTYWGYTKGADWLVIFGAVGVCWLIL